MDGHTSRRNHFRLASYSIAAMLFVLCFGSATAMAASDTARCNIESDGKNWCAALSTQYPSTKGWYGWVGLPAGPCNSAPLEHFYADGLVGICMAPGPQRVWHWSNGSWMAMELAVGTKAYVAPFSADWRWIYTAANGWQAIRADHLWLRWKTA